MTKMTKTSKAIEEKAKDSALEVYAIIGEYDLDYKYRHGHEMGYLAGYKARGQDVIKIIEESIVELDNLQSNIINIHTTVQIKELDYIIKQLQS